MLTLPPKFFSQSAQILAGNAGGVGCGGRRSEVLFLADRSGSMGAKMAVLKSAMRFFLKGIPLDRAFNVWSFGSGYTSWCPKSVDYTEANLAAALAYIDDTKFAANMGGTELLQAIEALVAARDKIAAVTSDVVLLTDGEVWRLDQTLDFIRQTRMRTEGRVRFFALGIGNAVSHALVEGIAAAGGGYAEVIPASASASGREDRVVGMLKAALTTEHLGPLHLEFGVRNPEGDVSGRRCMTTPAFRTSVC